MQRQLVEMSSCTDRCGTLTLHLKQRFENVCKAQQVRCEGMRWQSVAAGKVYGQSEDKWVQLGAGEYTDFDVALPAPIGSFDINGPNLESQCKFTA